LFDGGRTVVRPPSNTKKGRLPEKVIRETGKFIPDSHTNIPPFLAKGLSTGFITSTKAVI
jgi:hypothetical protein